MGYYYRPLCFYRCLPVHAGGGRAWLLGGLRDCWGECAWLLGGMHDCWGGHVWLLGGMRGLMGGMHGSWGACVIPGG